MLHVGRVSGAGMRGYLLVAGGIAAPRFLGSSAAFTLGEFGGHAGRGVLTGDTLHLARQRPLPARDAAALTRPEIAREWTVRVLYGPHDAPDFFTPGDIETLCTAPYQVHYNSSRTGVRLNGPKPNWARADGAQPSIAEARSLVATNGINGESTPSPVRPEEAAKQQAEPGPSAPPSSTRSPQRATAPKSSTAARAISTCWSNTAALAGAEDITRLGDWRAYIARGVNPDA